ncbi:related to SHR3 - endoplasmatic reticulum membrane protein [Cephalotrichum gorgonifer]|uniref:Related to SHR3 - endoplasmatic reticulum membrane protein n=1 Tax=Cephalotrichum gorgonifer TaxID=2041049 RepID=A0AAE8SR14_9PEZI|nr:related to SHR3 - endoplasmatic reticulum membrane protein [Cephalotrichum gorgonifer]
MIQLVNWNKTPLSPDYRGSGSFATFMIIGSTCFFLGILFASFPYDFPLLWTAAPVPDSYYDILETHLRWMHQAPPLISRVLNIITTVGFLGFAIKLYRPAVLNFLFDGASLLLYVIGCMIWIRSIVKRLRLVSAGTWPGEEDGVAVSRKDNVKLLSMSNTILALVLVGVLVLQVGQWYAEAKEVQDIREDEALHKLDRKGSGLQKKKQ